MKAFITRFSIILILGLTALVSKAQIVLSGLFDYELNEETATATLTRCHLRNIKVDIPSSVRYKGKDYTVTSIGNYAFYDISSLTNVTIPNSVTSIGNYAFHFCSNLTSVTIPNSVTSIGKDAFASCTSLTEVTIGNSVTEIGDLAFLGCRSLREVTIPTSVIYIGESAFFYCDSLNSINVDKNNRYYADIDGILYDKNITLLIQCPCAMTSATIPTSVTSIGKYAFWYCHNLTSVIIPNSVTSIGYWAFGRCSSLTDVTIPNSVTSIGEEAFRNCGALTSVTLPASVTSIGSMAFSNCGALKEVYYAAETPIEGNNNIFSASAYENATLFVPETAVAKCKEIDPWKNFGNIAVHNFTGIDAAEVNEPVITLSPMTINVSGVDDDCEVSVYTLAGQLIASERGNCSVAVANRGMYIVKVGTRVEKVSVTR